MIELLYMYMQLILTERCILLGFCDWMWIEPAKSVETIGYVVAVVQMPKHHHRHKDVDFDHEDKMLKKKYEREDKKAAAMAKYYVLEFQRDEAGDIVLRTLFAQKDEPLEIGDDGQLRELLMDMLEHIDLHGECDIYVYVCSVCVTHHCMYR